MSVRVSTRLLCAFVFMVVLTNIITPILGQSQVDWIFHTYEVKQTIRDALIYHMEHLDELALQRLESSLDLTSDNPLQTKQINMAMLDIKTKNQSFEQDIQRIIQTENTLLHNRREGLNNWRNFIVTIRNLLSVGLIVSLFITMASLNKLGH